MTNIWTSAPPAPLKTTSRSSPKAICATSASFHDVRSLKPVPSSFTVASSVGRRKEVAPKTRSVDPARARLVARPPFQTRRGAPPATGSAKTFVRARTSARQTSVFPSGVKLQSSGTESHSSVRTRVFPVATSKSARRVRSGQPSPFVSRP